MSTFVTIMERKKSFETTNFDTFSIKRIFTLSKSHLYFVLLMESDATNSAPLPTYWNMRKEGMLSFYSAEYVGWQI